MKHLLGMVCKNSLEGLNMLTVPTLPLVLMWIKAHRYLVLMNDPKLNYVSFPSTYESKYKEDKIKIKNQQYIKLNNVAKGIQKLNSGGPDQRHSLRDEG